MGNYESNKSKQIFLNTKHFQCGSNQIPDLFELRIFHFYFNGFEQDGLLKIDGFYFILVLYNFYGTKVSTIVMRNFSIHNGYFFRILQIY